MIVHDVVQGSSEWHKVRLGKFTASTFAKLFMGKTTAGYDEEINRVVFERMTGEAPESFQSEWMKRGNELESAARQAYQMQSFNKVTEVGFVELDEWVGCSPDGLVGEDGLVQIKVPKFSTLINYLLDGKVPKDYMIQMQGEMMVAERAWSDFFVWHPKFKSMLVRVKRDETVIGGILTEIGIAKMKVIERINKLKG